MESLEVESLISQLDLGFIARICALEPNQCQGSDYALALEQVMILYALTDSLDERVSVLEISADDVDQTASLQDNENHGVSQRRTEGT